MITKASGRGPRHGLKCILALTLVWLLTGVVKESLLFVLGEIPSRCSGSFCLPLPRDAAGSGLTISSWDFASRAAAQEPVLAAPATDGEAKEAEKKEEHEDGESLFDGESLKGWKESDFAGQGSVEVSEGRMLLGVGQDLTGVTWDGDELPKTNYEIELEAMRVDGSDFFCGLTFPVRDDHCSLIIGGWGGTIVGLSSIDRFDASMNETTKFMKFEKGKWYKVKVRVTPENITAWIEDKEVVDFDIEKHKISTRIEVRPSQPLGIACWQTSAALRAIRLRRLADNADDPSNKGEAPAGNQGPPQE